MKHFSFTAHKKKKKKKDLLNDPDLDPDVKILVLFYIFLIVLPELYEKMPKKCLKNHKKMIKWLEKELKNGNR
jgi:hypothetical protein